MHLSHSSSTILTTSEKIIDIFTNLSFLISMKKQTSYEKERERQQTSYEKECERNLNLLKFDLREAITRIEEEKKIINEKKEIELKPQLELMSKRKKHKYQEAITFDGFKLSASLRIKYDEWDLILGFPGPDRRYNWTYVYINMNDIDDYIRYFFENWIEYERLKQITTLTGTYSVPGKLGMTINIGGRYDGVCLEGNLMPVNNQMDLNLILEKLKYCKSKSQIVLEWFDKEDNLK